MPAEQKDYLETTRVMRTRTRRVIPPLLKQGKKHLWIITINGEEPIIDQGALDELNRHQNPHGKSKVKISLCIRKSWQIKNIEYICSIFDQVLPVVSHHEFRLSEKLCTPKKIGEALKVPERKWCKKALFVKYYKNKNVNLLPDTIPIKYLYEGTKVLRSLIANNIKEGGCYDAC